MATILRPTCFSKQPGRWLDDHGEPITCYEKIKMLNENYKELQDICEQALEDAVLMGCNDEYVREIFQNMIAALPSPVRK